MKNYILVFIGNLNDPGIIPRTLLLVFNTLNNKLMPQCKYKPDKVIAAHILDENLIKAEECFRDNILNNWCNEKIQVNFEHIYLMLILTYFLIIKGGF